MKEFKIVTRSTCYTEYIVKAESATEAEEKYFNGEFESSRETDYRDEEIVETTKLD